MSDLKYWLQNIYDETRTKIDLVHDQWKHNFHLINAVNHWFNSLDLLLNADESVIKRFKSRIDEVLPYIKHVIILGNSGDTMVTSATLSLYQDISKWIKTFGPSSEPVNYSQPIPNIINQKQIREHHELLDETDYIVHPIPKDQLAIFPQMRDLNLVTIQTPGDGSCMLHGIMKAISYEGYTDNRNITRRADIIRKARQEIADLVFDRRETGFTNWDLTLNGAHAVNHMAQILNPQVDIYKTASQLYEDLRNYDRWLGENVIPFLSEFFDVDICLYFQVTGKQITPSLNSRIEGKNRPIILLLNNDNMHYRVVGLHRPNGDIITLFDPSTGYYDKLAPPPAGTAGRGHDDFIRAWNDFIARNDPAELDLMHRHLVTLGPEITPGDYGHAQHHNKDLYFVELVNRLTENNLIRDIHELFPERDPLVLPPDVPMIRPIEDEWIEDDEGLVAAIQASLRPGDAIEHEEPGFRRVVRPPEPPVRYDYGADEDDEEIRQLEEQTLADYYRGELRKQELELERQLREEQDAAFRESEERDRRRLQEQIDKQTEEEERIQRQEIWKMETEQRIEEELLPTDLDPITLQIRFPDQVYPITLNVNERVENLIDLIRLTLYELEDENFDDEGLTLMRAGLGPISWDSTTRIGDLNLDERNGISEILTVDFY